MVPEAIAEPLISVPSKVRMQRGQSGVFWAEVQPPGLTEAGAGAQEGLGGVIQDDAPFMEEPIFFLNQD